MSSVSKCLDVEPRLPLALYCTKQPDDTEQGAAQQNGPTTAEQVPQAENQP